MMLRGKILQEINTFLKKIHDYKYCTMSSDISLCFMLPWQLKLQHMNSP